MFFLAGCSSPDVNIQLPTASPPQTGPSSTQATGTVPPEEIFPGSGGDTSQVPLPVIILTPDTQNPSSTLEADMTPATAEQSKQILLATQDLAERLNIPAEEISLIDITSVVWPDGSLGCPQPDMFYTQALVEGMRIRLQVGGVIYHYHSGRNQAPFLCENPSDETGVPGDDVTE
jgi:hypothetical protein